MREMNLINEFAMKDGENFDKLNNQIKKNYELSFEDLYPKAWWHRSSSRRLSQNRIDRGCVIACKRYLDCISHRYPRYCYDYGCNCDF